MSCSVVSRKFLAQITDVERPRRIGIWSAVSISRRALDKPSCARRSSLFSGTSERVALHTLAAAAMSASVRKHSQNSVNAGSLGIVYTEARLLKPAEQ